MAQVPERKIVRTRIKSALPIFAAAAVFFLIALIKPYSLVCLLIAGALAAGAYYALDKLVFTGRVTESVREVLTGDEELDAQIRQSRVTLAKFRETAAQAGDEKIAADLNRIADSAERIIDEVVADPRDRGDANTFFSYYMPTLDKLLGFYTSFASAGNHPNAVQSRARIEGCLGMVADSFDKFLDQLYRNEAGEIKVSIEVLKTMLRSDGLAQKPDATPQASGIDAQIEDISRQLQTGTELENRQLSAH